MSEIASSTLLTCLRFTSPAASTTAFTRALLLIEPAFFASVFFPAMISPPGRACRGPKQSQGGAQIQTRSDVPREKKGAFRVADESAGAARGWSETAEMRAIAL